MITKPLTNKEIEQIDKRIDEIKATIKLCDEHRDRDVIANLEAELSGIIAMLEHATRLAEQEEYRQSSGLLRFNKRA